ncbi:MAG: sigma-70 family RNA polymerase sigma factor [Opitutales bacterium]
MSTDDNTESFIRLLAEHERRLAVYVTSLVGRPQDAQDILQEGKLVMWRHFERFEKGTNFGAWARKILFNQVLSYRRKLKRIEGQMLNENILEMLHEESETAIREERWMRREKHLKTCMQSLKTEHQDILHLRYRDEMGIETIAQKIGRTEGAVYRLLSRLRRSLYDCVENKSQGVGT